jgi:L-threonylcarbamoyladenylate synthase
MLKSLVADIPPRALQLMKKFWPGPLTLVFQARENLNPLITAGSGKVGIRIPDNPFCLKLLKESKTSIVSTSANISGKATNFSVESLKKLFADRVDMFIDAGDLPQSLPSTVLDVSEGMVKIVREGVISRKNLVRFLSNKMWE